MQNKLFLKAADICELLEVKQTSACLYVSRKKTYSAVFGPDVLSMWLQSPYHAQLCFWSGCVVKWQYLSSLS